MIKLAVTIAVVASAETLLCATAVDKMHMGPRTRYDHELAAQGVGNMLCGVLGALPMTGVIVRSSANIEAGARTRASTILHGLWLLLFVSLLPDVLSMIPTSSLAAILVYTGYKLVDVKAIRNLWGFGKGEVFIYACTVVTIVMTDLLTGVLVGVALAVAKLLYTFSHLADPPGDVRQPHRHAPGGGGHVHQPAQTGRRPGNRPAQHRIARPLGKSELHRSRLPGSAHGLGKTARGDRRQPGHGLGRADGQVSSAAQETENQGFSGDQQARVKQVRSTKYQVRKKSNFGFCLFSYLVLGTSYLFEYFVLV